MKKSTLTTILFLAIATTSSGTKKTGPTEDPPKQNILSKQTQKIAQDFQKEMDKVLIRYEEKLDQQLQKVEEKMDVQVEKLDDRFDSIQQKLDDQVSKAEGRLDETFDKVDSEMGDVKSTLLDTVGTVAWRFTIVDIVTALLATFLTAFLTSYLTAKKIQVEKFRKELETMLEETRASINTTK